MKILPLLCLLLTGASVFALKTDSLYQRHMLSFSVTDAVSQEFIKGSSGPTINEKVYGVWYRRESQYLPGYAMHLEINYSIGITKNIRFETGLGYLLKGITIKSRIETGDLIYAQSNYTDHQYIGRMTIPLHVKFIKPLHKGAFTCTVGPGFNFDVNHINIRDHYTVNGKSQPSATSYNTLDDYIGGPGIDLKMGYEKQLSRRLAIDIGPVINFTDPTLFGKYLKAFPVNVYSAPNLSFDYYVGVEVALNFGLKK